MKNLFKNIEFGDKFKTTNGKIAIFLRAFICNGGYNYYMSTGDIEYFVDEDGKVNKILYPYEEDVVSEWEESADNKKLDELAEEEYPYEYETSLYGCEEAEYKNELRDAFKAGYRKAMGG